MKGMEKVKILGISGSPRRDGNTAGMVKDCLKAAEAMGYVETEYLSLADYKLEYCTGCMKCFGYMAPADDNYECYDANDDTKVLAPKLLECDALLIGFPVYTLGIPGLVRVFMEKMHGYGPMSFTKFAGMLRYKPIGIISQGGVVYGGQEVCVRHVWDWAIGLGMLPIGAWPTVEDSMPQAAVHAAILTTVDGSVIYGKSAYKKETTRTMPPTQGSRNERVLRNQGRHLAVAAMMIKLGMRTFDAESYKKPELISFTRYSVKPKPGTWIDKLMKEGRVTYVSSESLEEEAKKLRAALKRD